MSAEPFKLVLDRIVAAQPEIFLQNHEGYYRHRDIAGLIQALVDHRAALENLLSDDYGTANARAEARRLLGTWKS